MTNSAQRHPMHFDPDPDMVRRYGHVDDEDEEDEHEESVEAVEASVGQLIARAAAVLEDLTRQTSRYPGIAWAVGAYLDEADNGVCYAVSNEGQGYLPLGLRWDPEVKPVFGLSVPAGGSPPWQGAANPARVMADHYEHQRKLSGGALQLVTILASVPLGRAVLDMMRQRSTAPMPPADCSATLSCGDQGVSRLTMVAPSLFTDPVPAERRWEAGCALAASAVEVSGVAARYPFLADTLDRMRDRDSSNMNPAVRQAYWWLTAQAQDLRVDDDRAGAVLLDPTPQRKMEHDVLPKGGVLGYATLFWEARACAILDLLTSFSARGRELGEEDLEELAYEHYCVVEDISATAEIVNSFR